MDHLKPYLEAMSLGGIRVYDSVSSTNDIALAWGEEAAKDWSLVIAERQTAGRGRDGRIWLSEPGSSLTFSLVLRPSADEVKCFPRFTALAALGLIGALANLGLKAEIKWPNDVLVEHKKIAGVLVESNWQGNQTAVVVVGMGVNVLTDSSPPEGMLHYPATSIEKVLGTPVDRWALLAVILQKMRHFRSILPSALFMQEWNNCLAMHEEEVRFTVRPGDEYQVGRLLRVNGSGELEIEKKNGELVSFVTGEILMEPF